MNAGASRAILIFKPGCALWAKRSQHLDRWLPISEGVAAELTLNEIALLRA